MTDILFNLGIKYPITPEDTKRSIEELKKASLSELGIKHSIPEGTMQRFVGSREKLKATLAEVAPNIDPDKFIKFLITSPFKIDRLNFETIVKLISVLESHLPVKNVKEAYSDMEALITVNQPQESEIEIDSYKYLQFIMNVVFPIILTLLTQYQTYQTTVQLNRMEAQQQQHTEQLNSIEDLLEQYIEQHQEEQIVEPDFIIELDGYDNGTRT